MAIDFRTCMAMKGMCVLFRMSCWYTAFEKSFEEYYCISCCFRFPYIIRKNVTEKQQTRGAFEFEGQQAKKCHSLMTKISTSLLCA